MLVSLTRLVKPCVIMKKQTGNSITVPISKELQDLVKKASKITGVDERVLLGRAAESAFRKLFKTCKQEVRQKKKRVG